jgi:UDP-glucose 4-epimerase
MQGKRVVVTGGAGFIGSNLADMLIENGNSVTVLDNLSTGKLSNISNLIKSKKIKFIKGDICNLGTVKKAFNGAEYVFHLAADISVPGSVENPAKTNKINIEGILNVLLAARDASVKKVVFSSSAAVYGNNPALPKREDMTPEPESPYAISKITGEYYCAAFSKLYGLKTASLRYFNVYGPRQDPNSQYAAAVPKFIDCALSGKPITIFGDGEQTRDFIFVKDVARANILAAESEATGTFNIAGGKSITINALAQEITKIAGNLSITPTFLRKIAGKVPINYAPSRPGDVRHSCASIQKTKEAFGFCPKWTKARGMRETIEQFRNK